MEDAQNVVRTMLSDTILALCKNTLPYNTQFTVEGLIGITLDTKDIFLININETIEKETENKKRDSSSITNEEDESAESETSSAEDENASRKRKRKRQRKKSNDTSAEKVDSENIENKVDNDTNDSSNTSVSSGGMGGVEGDVNMPKATGNVIGEVLSAPTNTPPKAAPVACDGSEGVMYIKEEPSDSACLYGGISRPGRGSQQTLTPQTTADLHLQELALQLSTSSNMSSALHSAQQANVVSRKCVFCH